jgi:glycosyltransferase involved in cell wall biosynthesis
VRKRIIWIIDSLGPGGAEQLTLSILKHFDKEKFELRVCTLQVRLGNPIAGKLEEAGIPVDIVLVPVLRHPANLPKIIWYLLKQNPNLIHTQLEFSDILGGLAARLLGIPSVSTLHTVGLPDPQDGQTANWRNNLMWFILRNFTSRIIAVSEDTRQFHIKEGKIPAEKVLTIYNGIDTSAFINSKQNEFEKLRESFGFPFDATVFVTVAVLREQKGIQFMLRAMPAILAEVPNSYYLIVGDGNHRDSLQEIVNSLKLEKNVFFTGHRSDIPEILGISDIFVLPTLTEALPTVLIEAMAAQKVIIASNVGGVPELVTNGVNGFLVRPANLDELAVSCIKLARNKPMSNAMAANGFEIASKRFTIQQQIKELSNLYEELIKDG